MYYGPLQYSTKNCLNFSKELTDLLVTATYAAITQLDVGGLSQTTHNDLSTISNKTMTH
jgi:hypothetical protein